MVIFDRRAPVRFQAVRSRGSSVRGHRADVLTVMMDFSRGMCEKPSSLAAAPLRARWFVFSGESGGRLKKVAVWAKRAA